MSHSKKMTESVILLHGFGGHHLQTALLARRLREAGYIVANVGYPSWRWPLERVLVPFTSGHPTSDLVVNSLSTVLRLGENTDLSCMGRQWIFHLSFNLAFGSLMPNFGRTRAELAARATRCREAHSGVLAQLHGTKELSCKKRLGWSWASRGSLYEVSAASIGHFYLVDRLIVLCTAPSMAREKCSHRV